MITRILSIKVCYLCVWNEAKILCTSAASLFRVIDIACRQVLVSVVAVSMRASTISLKVEYQVGLFG